MVLQSSTYLLFVNNLKITTNYNRRFTLYMYDGIVEKN